MNNLKIKLMYLVSFPCHLFNDNYYSIEILHGVTAISLTYHPHHAKLQVLPIYNINKNNVGNRFKIRLNCDLLCFSRLLTGYSGFKKPYWGKNTLWPSFTEILDTKFAYWAYVLSSVGSILGPFPALGLVEAGYAPRVADIHTHSAINQAVYRRRRTMVVIGTAYRSLRTDGRGRNLQTHH